jgi:signal transduction histidine kinase/PleD family two-component response regulator
MRRHSLSTSVASANHLRGAPSVRTTMRDQMSPHVREAIQAESKAQIANRVSVIFALSAVFLLAAVPANRELGADIWHRLMIARVGGAVVQLVLAVALRASRHASWTQVITLALATFASGFATTLAVAVLTGDPWLLVFVLVLVLMLTYVIFPWGVLPHVVLTVLALACLAGVLDQLSVNVMVAVVAAFAISNYAAIVFDRQYMRTKAGELLREGHERVLELIAGDAAPGAVFGELLRILAQQAPELRAAVVLPDRETGTLHVPASAGLAEAYVAALADTRLDDDNAITAALRDGQPTFVALIDEETCSRRPYDAAHASGIASCWSVPLRGVSDTVLGAIVVHRRAAGRPTRRQRELVSGLGRLAVVALERQVARVQLEQSFAELEGARRRAEEQSVQLAEARDEAFASARAKSEFLANMSHEIRTPLNGVIGLTELLLDSPLAEGDREHVVTVRRCGEHLLGVINDILDFSKIEAGKMPIDSIDFEVGAVVEEAAELVAAQAQDRGLELLCDVPSDAARAVTGDPARLRQVLLNLLGNAVKFTERGEVAVEVRLLRETATSVVMRIVVRDTGIGIPQERHAAIFESFTQADGSTTRRHGGTGLGLTICRQLVELMGGRIGLESATGGGSTFWIELALPKAQVESRRAVGADRLTGLQVLMVDDNETNRLILRRTLAAWGCHTVEASAGVEALLRLDEQHAAGTPIRIAILDMHMPEMDGQELARRIQADARFAELPLVLLSSMGALADARQMGFAEALAKPVRQATLLRAILSALGGRVEPRPAEPAPAFRALSERLRVLLAEDNRVNRLVAINMLQRFGCDVDAAETGREAVEAVAAKEYDLVLMDVQMPEMDGFEATAEIRRREAPGQRLPIIAMTAHAMHGDQERCLAAGMDDYVAKPVTRAALVAKLERWIVERRGRAAAARRRQTADVAKEAAQDAAGTSGPASATLDRA